MIINFSDEETEKVYNQVFSTKLPVDIQKTALRKLIMIDNSHKISDLAVPPSNRLEKLKGNMSNRWSIRINDQWRISFVPVNNGQDYKDVQIIDYH